MVEIELKTGEVVTFDAYARPIKAKVGDILIGYPFGKYRNVSYRLTGIDEPLISVSTGLSIRERVNTLNHTLKDE